MNQNSSRTSNGFAALHLLLLIVIAAAVIGTGYFVYTAGNKANANLDKADDSVSTNTTVKKKSVAAVDIPADWETYKSVVQNFSIRYPKTWKLETQKYSANDENAKITASSGLYVQYVLLAMENNEEFPEVGSCGRQSSCGADDVVSIDTFTLNNKNSVELVKIGTNQQNQDGIYVTEPGYSMYLHMPTSAKSTPVLGPNKLGSGKDGFTIYYKIKGKNGAWLSLKAVFPESYSLKTPSKVFGSEEAKTAEKILRSVRFISPTQ